MKEKYMHKKLFSCLIVLLALLCVFLYCHHEASTYNISSAVVCEALEYKEASAGGQLTVKLGDGEIVRRMRVEDTELNKMLSDINLEDVIGILFFINLPNSYIKEKHIEASTIDHHIYDILLTDPDIEEYLLVADVSVR